jgi:hypothetical protein
VAEAEPNDSSPGQPLPASGWVGGAIGSTADHDYYSLTLSAGDSVFLSLDLDPERDGVDWNGMVGLGTVGNPPGFLVSDDPGNDAPNSEAFFLTVLEAGTYSVQVAPKDGTVGTYHLSVSVWRASTRATRTFTSTDRIVIPNGPAVVTSTLHVPDDVRIDHL